MRLSREPYVTFLSQMYSIPIEQSYYPMNFISFVEASSLLGQNLVEKYEVDPILQVWSGFLQVSNNQEIRERIITLYLKNGNTYLVKALYNPITQQISQS